MNKPIINNKSLKEQVYEYLRNEFHHHRLKSGSMINMEETSKKLGISKTPLREALLQLEMENFVTIVPRQGIFVNRLTIDEIRELYQVIGALESSAILDCTRKIKKTDIEKMAKLNDHMKDTLAKDKFDLFYEKNLAFHNTFIDLTKNETLIRIVNNCKKRLYDFPRQEKWIKVWEQASTVEHGKLVELLNEGDFVHAALHMENVHWSFEKHEPHIKKYYGTDLDKTSMKE